MHKTEASQESDLRSASERERKSSTPLLEESVGFRLSRLARSRRSRWAGELRSVGLTPPQAAILRGTTERSNASLRALARTMGTDPMSVKRCVDDLEARGLLRSAISREARRARVVRLTPAGERLTTELEEMARRQEAEIRALLSKSEYAQLLAVIDRLERGMHLSGSDDDLR
jgi:DNA-binding MarR family transcriptional regulator